MNLKNKPSCLLTLSESDIKNAKIRFTPCGKSFFPVVAFGGPTQDTQGRQIKFNVKGIGVIKTDLPTDINGRPRWFCRNRSWIKDFIVKHDLKPNSKIEITRESSEEYLIKPICSEVKFIDLFAGIGGIRKGFEFAGGKCIFSSEWDKFAKQTYEANFGEKPKDDITKIDENSIPDHDILTAGFPCQPFSIAGVSKKKSLGKKHGFADETQGTLFFDILRILKAKQPKAFLLENVRNLKSHDKGRTFKIIKSHLEDLGYSFYSKIIDGQLVTPQHRERIYMVGFKPKLEFEFPTDEEISNYRLAKKLGEILDKDIPEKYTLTDHLWKYLQEYKKKHQKAGNGFGYGLVTTNDTTRTLSARYHKDGSEILIKQKNANPRRLTPIECSRLMGFVEPRKNDFIIPVSDTQAYRQFGNSVVVPVIKAIATKIIETLNQNNSSK